jgi:hypothetical protein
MQMHLKRTTGRPKRRWKIKVLGTVDRCGMKDEKEHIRVYKEMSFVF